jgi:hypothetical protein
MTPQEKFDLIQQFRDREDLIKLTMDRMQDLIAEYKVHELLLKAQMEQKDRLIVLVRDFLVKSSFKIEEDYCPDPKTAEMIELLTTYIGGE